MKQKLVVILFIALIAVSCGNDTNKADAYGSFEADEINLSSELNAKIIEINATEGSTISENQVLLKLDTTQLFLRKLQLESQINAVLSKTRDIAPQINVLIEQKRAMDKEKTRFEALVADSAAPKKQLDDILSQIAVIEKNITATTSTLSQTNKGILSEIEPLRVQISQIEDNISRSIIRSPINGTLLKSYSAIGELATMGRILFKIANLDELYLKAYISGSQLSEIRLGQEVEVRIDKSQDDYYSYTGKITFISDKSEFTPKIIQTKDERVNLVYPMKVLVKNDGQIKIGMPGEVIFRNQSK